MVHNYRSLSCVMIAHDAHYLDNRFQPAFKIVNSTSRDLRLLIDPAATFNKLKSLRYLENLRPIDLLSATVFPRDNLAD